jgi:magnesium transporter
MSIDWHDIRDPFDPELDRLAERYELHPLHIEDCRHRNQNAKIEESNGYLFVVLKPVLSKPDGSLEICDLDVFFGPRFVVTVQEGGECEIEPMLRHIRAIWDAQRGDQLLYRIMDAIVDSYVPTLDRFSDTIDEIEDRVLTDPTPDALARIFSTKRCFVQMRRVLANTRDVAGWVQRTQSGLIAADMWPFLRDVYDHLVRDLDLLETHRDLLNGALDIYLSSVANRTNRVMKVLTVLGTAALPALIVSGMYGMNLQWLPWANSPHAFSAVVLLMAGMTAALLILLRLMRWL